jgi:hypothetical protein
MKSILKLLFFLALISLSLSKAEGQQYPVDCRVMVASNVQEESSACRDSASSQVSLKLEYKPNAWHYRSGAIL